MRSETSADPHLKTYRQLVERHLGELFAEPPSPYDRLFQAARYSLFNGGKRLRPLLTLAVCDLLGGDLEIALNPACAIEMIHTYSLIHDDLPSMDDDDLRRGKPSLHRAFDEGLAILTGDYLLTRAFELLATTPLMSDKDKLNLIGLISKAAGAQGMIGGQVIDLSGDAVTLESLAAMHRLKTGALFHAAVLSGAIVAQAPEDHYKILGKFASLLGLAFQIQDDVQDATGDEKNYATLLGVEKAKQEVQRLAHEACELLSVIQGNHAPLTQIVKGIVAG